MWDDPMDKYRRGSYKQIDDRTGFVTRANRSKKEWTGAIVDEDEWEARHPQDFVRGRPEHRSPNPSPEPVDDFLSVGQVTADDL
jgi:hypothetical protein